MITDTQKEDTAVSGMISIIMPAYNAQRTLHQAVDSALCQTYQNIELLIIDDFSSDSTGQIAEEYIKQDRRVRLLKNNKNLGVAASRNRGVAAARGEWVAFLDSDDAWAADKLEKQLSCAAARHGEFIFTGSAFMDADGNRKVGLLHVPAQVTYKELLKQNVISCSSVMIKKSLVCKYKMAGDFLHEDFAVWLQILRDGKTAFGVDEPLLIYRLSAGSKSGNKWKAAKMTYRVYRHIGLNVFSAVYYWMHYLFRSVRKYSKLVG